MRKRKYIRRPLKTDWVRESSRNGEKSVPAIRLALIDLRIVRRKKLEKFRFRAARITAFPKPRRKKGTVRGKSISAYEKSSVSAVSQAI